MAESIKQFMLNMINESKAQSTEDMLERGEIPDKPTNEFSMFELDQIMQARPTAIFELFSRSGWTIDDAGREAIADSMDREINKSHDLDKKTKIMFNEMGVLEREVIIQYRAIALTTLGSQVFGDMHVKTSANILTVPKYIEDFNYETLIVCITIPRDNVGLIFNTLNGQRVVTSATRAKRFYLDAFIAELEDKGIKLKKHNTSIDSEDKKDKLHVTLIGHLFKEHRLSISIDDLLAESAMNIVKEKLRSKIQSRFHPQDDQPEDTPDKDKDESSASKFSTGLKFPKWSDDIEGSDDIEDDEDPDNFLGGFHGRN